MESNLWPKIGTIIIPARLCGKLDKLIKSKVEICELDVLIDGEKVGEVLEIKREKEQVSIKYKITIPNKYLNGTVREMKIIKP